MVGKPVLVGLKRADGAAELHAFFRIVDCAGERFLRTAQRLGGKANPAACVDRADRRISIGERFGLGRIERDGGEGAGLVHGHMRGHSHPRRIGVHQPRLPRRDENEIGHGAMRHKVAGAGQPSVRAGKLGKAFAGGNRFAGNQARQPFGLLLRCRRPQSRAPPWRGRVQRYGRHLCACRFCHDREFDHAQPRAACRFGKADPGKAQFLTEGGPQIAVYPCSPWPHGCGRWWHFRGRRPAPFR